MDASSSFESTKVQKLSQGQSSSGGDLDRISDLTDDLLHAILFFLPTKDVVASCVLSTRWKHIWTGVQSIDFRDSLYDNTNHWSNRRVKNFMKFVDRVLLHNKDSKLRKLSLQCLNCDATHLKKWISVVQRQEVQDVSLTISNQPSYIVSSDILTRESLKRLKLELGFCITVGESTCFANLKVLVLRYIKFSGENLMHEISLMLPAVVQLSILDCMWCDINLVHIFAPSLKVFKVSEHQHGLHLCDLNIDAESLVSLSFSGYMSSEYSLCHLSYLEDASIEFYGYKDLCNVGPLLKKIVNVKRLKLSAATLKDLSMTEFLAYACDFSHLVHLTMVDPLIEKSRSGKDFIELLCLMPNLESLIFIDGLGTLVFKRECRLANGTTPHFLSHLKMVDIRPFSWNENEIRFVKFLIRSASGMDKLKLILSSCPSNVKQRKRVKLEKYAKKYNCVILCQEPPSLIPQLVSDGTEATCENSCC